MEHKKTLKLLLFVCLIISAFFLTNCESEEDEKAVLQTQVPTPTPTPVVSTTITGVAASGASITGIVIVKGALGNTVSTDIDVDGSYSVDVSELTAPYILSAKGTANGIAVDVYSAALETGTTNITPITNYIAKKILGKFPADAFDTWDTDSNAVTPSSVETAETEVQAQLAPLLEAAGVGSDVNLISDTFSTDHTGVDAVIDMIRITYDSSDDATVTNVISGTAVSEGEEFNDSEITILTQALTEREEIQQVFTVLMNLFATRHPTDEEIDVFFSTHVAMDYLNDGRNESEERGFWKYAKDILAIGLTFDVSIAGDASVDNVLYNKAYWVNARVLNGFETQNMLNLVVKRTSDDKWLWYGDQIYANLELLPFAWKNYAPNGPPVTGLRLNMDDENNHTRDKGVNSAVVSGPGLPGSGIPMAITGCDNENFCMWNGSEWDRSDYWISDDAVIAAIPENSVYTIVFCADSTDDIKDGVCVSIIDTITKVIPGKPLTNAEAANNAYYPVVTEPAPANVGDFAGGVDSVKVSWINPSNGMAKVKMIQLDQCCEENWDLGENITSGSSVTFDTSDKDFSNISSAGIFFEWNDVYGRLFNTNYDWLN